MFFRPNNKTPIMGKENMTIPSGRPQSLTQGRAEPESEGHTEPPGTNPHQQKPNPSAGPGPAQPPVGSPSPDDSGLQTLC